MSRSKRIVALALSVLLIGGLVGCGDGAKKTELVPKIAPPLIATEGVLRAGVDLSYPPFAGEDDGQKAGIDVDVAAALAERLGLTLELVDVKAADAPAALKGKQIDIALGAVPIADAVLADVTVAGSYFTDGPALFSMVTSGTATPTVTPEGLGALRVGAQKGSSAYWTLESDYGEGFAASSPTLREAFTSLASGDLDVVVADAAVGAYLARDFPGATFAGQYGVARPLGVLVMKDAADFETAIRNELDALAAEGVLDAIRTKWVGLLPSLEAAESEDASVTP